MNLRRAHRKLVYGFVAALGVWLFLPAVALGSQSSGAAVVSIEQSPAGNVLVVGGKGAAFFPGSTTAAYPAGSSLYTPSIDPPVSSSQVAHGYSAGCNAKTTEVSALEESQDPAVKGPPYPPFSCAGSETDQYADWPALTTKGAPVAGKGVHKSLLGTVYRSDIHATQVTYAGHPLYLFDPGPKSYAGGLFYETVSPLFSWHTEWFLLSPDGRTNPGPAKLTSEAPHSGTSYSTSALAVDVLPTLGGIPVTVYSFSRDSSHQSRCTGSCAREFVPVLTNGTPVESGVTGRLGTVVRSDGSKQVTFDGHPLYVYSREQPLLLSATSAQGAGNGNGVHAFGGIFDVVGA